MGALVARLCLVWLMRREIKGDSVFYSIDARRKWSFSGQEHCVQKANCIYSIAISQQESASGSKDRGTGKMLAENTVRVQVAGDKTQRLGG